MASTVYFYGRAMWVAATALLSAAPALAQTVAAPSRTVPESLAPRRDGAEAKFQLPATTTLEPPAGAEKITDSISRILVEGPGEEAADAINAANASIAGRRVAVSDLYAVAGRIEAALIAKGLVLKRVSVPPQSLTEGGVFRIVITDGFIETVDDTALRGPARKAVHARLLPLVGVRGLTLAQIERHVLLAGDLPGMTLRSTLLRGETPGGVKLVVNGEWRPVSGAIAWNNDLGPAFRYSQFTAQIGLNGVLGLGETIYAQVATGPDFRLHSSDAVRRVLAAGVILPLGRNGLTVNPEYLHVDTNPVAAAGVIQSRGSFDRVSLHTSYPLVRRRQQTLVITGGLEITDEKLIAPQFGVELNADRLRVVNLGLDWDRRLGPKTRTSSHFALNRGILGFGARTLADALASNVPLSRAGAIPDFTKIDGYAKFERALPVGFIATTHFRGQAALSGPMPSSGQFSLDGNTGVSGFATGAVNVDNGVTGRFELSRPTALNARSAMLSGQAAPYVFAAYGWGSLDQPSNVESRYVDSWSFGGGVKVQLAPKASRTSAQGGIQISRAHANIFAADQTRVALNLNFEI